MPVKRKTSRVANEFLSVVGQINNPTSSFHTRYQANEDLVLKDLVKKYRLSERRVQFLMATIERKKTKAKE
jgi:hypothetical protein